MGLTSRLHLYEKQTVIIDPIQLHYDADAETCCGRSASRRVTNEPFLSAPFSYTPTATQRRLVYAVPPAMSQLNPSR